ncbi:thiamine-phosphate kinase [Bradyrhizobium diazoefficiens]|uniref:Thiamine-monophosphate kinase n=2 Tax=Bradyrhizobium diazoefficiens TaxID=1355477 RepID=Q89K82_BRADU|nr:thiamine-phosphate kinase [Bradyrhizobium diazoefficiens]AND90245.1 thiamine-monophosphate kinase [Bradyrhizobium diazoefficiens USDA 110]QBP23809.1 thiamine-phosphate kinase [Bradyrhizobium diazoefficiens]QLD43191.1 thiamine-phosphate kinase [Bradyrhizobium diazoefficiens]WLB35187.1 thiamine-phosphate kinase [Bradyrhizobium diazoefficiens]WLC19816.1 thiamine-phosphate kinase [Bradyrhizobium diazoefficiens]
MTNAPENSAEDSLIARYFKPLATDPGAFGLVDDAAVLSSSGDDIVVTTDAVIEGVHYLATDPPDTIARKALRVNLSDLAAKGAVPAGFVLTLALRSKEDAWLGPFADALGEDAKTFACPLLGGDTVSTPGPQMISITAFGRVPRGRMVGRTGARPGDRILVTGTIGDAALGLDVLTGGAAAAALASDPAAREALVSRYRIPQPRNVLARAVRDHASAAMDVSDGLAGDLTKLCAASGVSASVDVANVPLSAAAAGLIVRNAVCVETLLAGGDDYEVLCTVPPAQSDALIAAGRAAGVAVTAIGMIVAGSARPRFLDGQGQELALKRLSYSHF